MRRNLLGGDDQFKRILKENRVVQRAAPLGRTSVTNGYTEFNGNESIVVNGSQKVTGWLIVTGTLKVIGTFLLEGITTITGLLNVNGPWKLAGNGDIAGNVSQTGTYSVASGGSIIVLGSVPMTIGTTIYGSGIVFGNNSVLSTSAGGMFMQDSTSAQVFVGGGLAQMRSGTGGRFLIVSASGTAVTGPFSTSGLASLASLAVTGAKSFRMPHPLKEGHDIQHGSTESPISGTEYTGEGKFDSAGRCVVELPDYFEALNKPRNRSVQLTPIGRPYEVGSERIVDGKFTVYGEPEREFFWVAKAERFGGDFDVEPETGSGALDDPAVGE